MENVSVEQAISLIEKNTKKILSSETKTLLDSSNRVLAYDAISKINQPPFNRSAFDGYACLCDDIQYATKENPVVLNVIDEVLAGQNKDISLNTGEAVRIMTGGIVPKNATCVIMQEKTDLGDDTVTIYSSCKYMSNICIEGEDYKKGSVLLKKDTKLNYIDAGILASSGIFNVDVYKKPVISLFTTGDEVIDSEDTLTKAKVYNSNVYLISNRLKELGFDVSIHKHFADDEEALAKYLKEYSKKSDLIITTGGVSVGKRDILHPALKLANANRVFWRVNKQPGTPVIFSTLNDIPILSLSGNPFACVANFELFGRVALSKLSSDNTLLPNTCHSTLQQDFMKKSFKRRYIRAKHSVNEKGESIVSIGENNSPGALSVLRDYNCFVEIKEGTEYVKKGTLVKVILL